MVTCKNCGGPMIDLFVSRACKNECDKIPRVAKTPEEILNCDHRVTYTMDGESVFCFICGKSMGRNPH